MSFIDTELNVSDGTRNTLAGLASDSCRPLLIITLKPDTSTCNKQLLAVEELHKRGTFKHKCTPIGVVVSTINEIEQWARKLEITYPIVQGTPALLEAVGSYKNGRAKRSCVLLSANGDIGFAMHTVRNGTSFIPKLIEYVDALEILKPIKANDSKSAPASAKPVPTKKAKQPASKKVTPELTESQNEKRQTTNTKAADSAITVCSTEEVRLKVTKKDSKPRKAAKPPPSREPTAASADTDEEQSVEVSVENTTEQSNEKKTGKKKGATSKAAPKRRVQKRSEPNSDIDSPVPSAATTGEQNNARKRIKINS